MEITYFVISIIEIILTVFLANILIKAEKKTVLLHSEINKRFYKFDIIFKKTGLILSSASKILKLYKIYLEEVKKLKGLYKAYKALRQAIMAAALIFGIKNRQKINFKKMIKFFGL